MIDDLENSHFILFYKSVSIKCLNFKFNLNPQYLSSVIDFMEYIYIYIWVHRL